jgi:5-methylthioribose kinase
VASEWKFDRGRIVNERLCMEYLESILPDGTVPKVLAHDDSRYLFLMSYAPDGGQVWKDQLLRGEVDSTTAHRAGELLGQIHSQAAGDPYVEQTFGSPDLFEQGRVDPYHRTTAKANPEVAAEIEAEIERMHATRTTLVLGDYSPKNLLVYPERVFAIDFEVAHLGDPAFDVAFLLTHLVLKAVHNPDPAAPLLHAATAFLDGYRAGAGAAADRPRPHSTGGVMPADGAVTAELGCLLLARVDGKSPAEYITTNPQRATIRAHAYRLLKDPPGDLDTTLNQLLAK